MSISVRHVAYRYPGSAAEALTDIELDAPMGACTLLVGPNGAGKSTLLRLLNGSLRPASGSIILNGVLIAGRSTAELAGEIAVTFQDPSDQIFESTVRREVSFGPRNLRRPAVGRVTDEALAHCGLLPHADEHPYDLPPAQRKLITLASAFAMDTPTLAFDEPTAGVSFHERRTISDVCALLLRKGRTLIIASHDLATFLPLASHVAVLRDGCIGFTGTPAEFEAALPRAGGPGVRLPLGERIRQLFDRHATAEPRV